MYPCECISLESFKIFIVFLLLRLIFCKLKVSCVCLSNFFLFLAPYLDDTSVLLNMIVTGYFCLILIILASCGGDPNAESGCGGNCGRRCSDYKKEDVACPLICMLNGCDCREGYVFDDNINKCVRPEDCSKLFPCC